MPSCVPGSISSESLLYYGEWYSQRTFFTPKRQAEGTVLKTFQTLIKAFDMFLLFFHHTEGSLRDTFQNDPKWKEEE